jgi:hypothetical protein
MTDFADITNKPTTVFDYGITDAFDGTFDSLRNKPVDLHGYGITEGFTGTWDTLIGRPTLATVATTGSYLSLLDKPDLNPVIYWSSIQDTPTTLAGYGITDGYTGGSTGSSSMTAADIISSLITVDGTGSNLDADLLDGQHGSYFAPIDSPVFTTQITTPLIYGSAAANGDISIEGTIHATKTTSIIFLQPNGGIVNIGSPWQSTRGLNIGDATNTFGMNLGGNLEFPPNKSIYMGSTSDAGSRYRTFQLDTTLGVDEGVYIDYYSRLRYRTGASASNINTMQMESDGDVSFYHNITVDGTSLISGIATFNDDLIGNEAFVSGFMGSGWKLDKNTDCSLTVDNLTVRKLMRVYELEINKINSVNGGIMVSVANGKAYSVSSTVEELNDWGYNTFTSFASSGLEITACTNTAGNYGFAYDATGGIGSAYTATTGEIITVSGFLTLNSGTAPQVLWTGTGVSASLVAGANSVTLSIVAGGGGVVVIRAGSSPGLDTNFSFTGVTITSNISKIVFDEDTSAAGTGNIIQFAANDYIRAQEWTGRGVNYYQGKVLSVVHSATLGSAYIRAMSTSGTPWTGAELVQVGNSSTAARQNMIYITASDTNNPYIQMVSGVTDGDFAGHTKVMLGNLESIASTGIVPASPGYGLYSDNVYLSGKIVASSGTIGGFTVNSTDGLYSGTGNTRVQMKSGAGFWAGETAQASAEFSVTADGTLTAVGNCTLGSATGQVDLGLTGSRGLVDAYSTIRHLGGKQNWSYSVQTDLGITAIEYSCYRLDTADVAKTLTLPSDAQMNSYQDATIILVNPTKANFTINSNSVPVYLKSSSSVTSFVIGEGYAYTLIYIDHGTNPGWYQI